MLDFTPVKGHLCGRGNAFVSYHVANEYWHVNCLFIREPPVYTHRWFWLKKKKKRKKEKIEELVVMIDLVLTYTFYTLLVWSHFTFAIHRDNLGQCNFPLSTSMLSLQYHVFKTRNMESTFFEAKTNCCGLENITST